MADYPEMFADARLQVDLHEELMTNDHSSVATLEEAVADSQLCSIKTADNFHSGFGTSLAQPPAQPSSSEIIASVSSEAPVKASLPWSETAVVRVNEKDTTDLEKQSFQKAVKWANLTTSLGSTKAIFDSGSLDRLATLVMNDPRYTHTPARVLTALVRLSDEVMATRLAQVGQLGMPTDPVVWKRLLHQYPLINHVLENDKNPERQVKALDMAIVLMKQLGDKTMFTANVDIRFVRQWNMWYWRAQNIVHDICVDRRLLAACTDKAMTKLREWLATLGAFDDKEKIHAIVWMFCELQRLHRYESGNGRVGRIWLQWALANIVGPNKVLDLSSLDKCRELDHAIATATTRYFMDYTFHLLFVGDTDALQQSLKDKKPTDTPLFPKMRIAMQTYDYFELPAEERWYAPVLNWVNDELGVHL